MKQITLKDLQGVLLDMMKDIHSFCMENNINYSLAYGSLIGAVRHKGFIPWDDDIDIWMTRPDYDRFSATYKSKKGYIMKSVNDIDCYTNFTRVYDVEKTLLVSPAMPCKGEIGAWIDVLPIDAVSDNEILRIKDYLEFKNCADRIMTMRGNLAKIKNGSLVDKFSHSIKYYVKCMMWGCISTMHKRLQVKMQSCSFGETKYCSNWCCLDALNKGEMEILFTKDFEKFELTSFEDTEFLISSQYDRILSTIYGDYMQLPPIEKRGVRHQSHKIYER